MKGTTDEIQYGSPRKVRRKTVGRTGHRIEHSPDDFRVMIRGRFAVRRVIRCASRPRFRVMAARATCQKKNQ